ncbi:GNAT family N-acetyltransferase [Edwardsiella tarda]|uniref:GNAT family N-acetyltransferase n=1 Tax=Edwardsiella tarda TaxID=636 RepID=UPI00351C6CE8
MWDKKPTLVTYTRVFLDKSWYWLNDPEIKKLTMTPNFSKIQQEAFFSSLPRDNYIVWGVLYDGVEIGVAGLKNIKNGSAEYFGFIGEKKYWGRGIFGYLLNEVIGECKSNDISYLYLYVSYDNSMAIKAYIKNGFKEDCNRIVDGVKYMYMDIK